MAKVLIGLLVVAIGYGLLAYVILPRLWEQYERQPGLVGKPMVTRTAQGIPGDPLNVGLVGTMDDIVAAMHAAGWYPADPITWRSSIEIVGSVLLDRPYRHAPVSDLYLEHRREDLAFEKPAGRSADQRHHVRFWQTKATGDDPRPLWLGAASFDRGVGLSHDTGQITHHIGPDLDAERNNLMRDLETAGWLQSTYEIQGSGATTTGRNGGGDPFFTDGAASVGVLISGP